MSATALFVFARCAGFAFRAPGFSHPSVPQGVRAAFALFLAVAIAPAVRASRTPLGAEAVPALAIEFLLGAAIGMAASLVYDGAYAGGRAIDDYVGVKAIAPSLQIVAPSGFGRVWSLAYTGGFFLSGAYRVTIAAFARSFALIPPGAGIDAHAWAAYAVGWALTIVGVGIAVAAPAIGLAFVVQIAIGALSRAVPRFGSFTLVFPLAFAAAIVAAVMTAPALTLTAVTPVAAIPHGLIR
ncbi:MAG: flagellar biosynthetic protein FliR [Candidatus Tumulicola sp.]